MDVFYVRESTDKLVFKTNCTKIKFTEKINFQDYDIVHSHGFIADAYVFFHRRHLNNIHITTIHQRIAPDYTMKYNALVGHLFEKLWLSLIPRNSFVVTLSRVMEAYYKQRIGSRKMVPIYNGIEVATDDDEVPKEDLGEILKLKEQHHIIGITARLIFLKGVDQIIKSLAINKDFALIVIGDGEKEKELKQLSKDLNVEDRCLFLGYKKNVFPYLKFFDVYAMSSRSEGFGLSVLEAASQKIPVVCSDLPIYKEIFTGDEVVKFELENIPSLARAFHEAIRQRTQLSEAAYLKFKNNFTADRMASNYLQLYRKLVKHPWQ